MHAFAVLDPAGPIALAERHVILTALFLSALVVLPVFGMLFFFAWKYRASAAASLWRHEPNWDHDSALAEVLWWVVPSVIIAFLALLAWQSAHELDPFQPLESDTAALTVQVVALDWKWLFIYPDQGLASVQMLEIPVDRPIHFELTADAPMNSFWIPQLGGQIMVMPGMTTQLNLSASKPGTYNGFSANISGVGFAGMAFAVEAVSEQDFENWVIERKAASNPLTDANYEFLAKPSEYNTPTTYAPIEKNLFSHVIQKFMMPSEQSGNSAMPGMTMTP